jgi:hypothetical protein
MAWLHLFVASGSPQSRKRVYRAAFWLSFIFTLDLVLTNAKRAADWSGQLQPPAHFVLVFIGIVGLLAAVLLWVGMVADCRLSQRPFITKSVWLIALFVGNIWAAEIYYLFFYPSTQESSVIGKDVSRDAAGG